MADRFLIQISRNWRLAEDDLQWILQRCRNGRRFQNERDHTGNWYGRSFCRTRKALSRCVRENVKIEDDEDSALIEAAVARVQAWPEMHRPRPGPLAGVAVEPAASQQQKERDGRNVA